MAEPSPFDSRSWGKPPTAGPDPRAAAPAPPKRPLPQRLGAAFAGRGGSRDDGPRRVVWLVSAAMAGVLGLGAGLAIKEFAVQPFRVPSASMAPTLVEGDQIVAEKISYILGGEPRRGQVIVFDGAGTYDATGAETTYYVKRVIAVAGDTVKCCDAKGRLLVNDSPVVESYVDPGKTKPFKKVIVGEGQLFVMGDNRGDSMDSRTVGTIDVDNVVGHVFARTWPLDRVETLPAK